MEKRWFLLLMAVVLAAFLTGCGGEREELSSSRELSRTPSHTTSVMDSSGIDSSSQTEAEPTESPVPAVSKTPSERSQVSESGSFQVQKTRLQITVGDQVFLGDLAETSAAESLVEMFPMTLGMGDWNAVAKSFSLPSTLPEEPENFAALQPGQLVLQGSGELLLVYGETSQGGSYTPLATVEEPQGLAQALSGQMVEVSFQMIEE